MIIDCSSGTSDGIAAIEAAATFSLDPKINDTITLVGDDPLITDTLKRIPCEAELLRVVHVDNCKKETQRILETLSSLASDNQDEAILTGASIRDIGRHMPAHPQSNDKYATTGAYQPVPVFREHGDERPSFALLGDIGLHNAIYSKQLVSIGQLAQIYTQTVLQQNEPSLTLLAVSNHDELREPHLDAHLLLRDSLAEHQYLGLSKPEDIFLSNADIILCDNYAGAIVSGLVESGLHAGDLLVERSKSGLRQRIGLRAIGDMLERLRHFADHETYGGTVVLGYIAPMLVVRADASHRAWNNACILANTWEHVNLREAIDNVVAIQ